MPSFIIEGQNLKKIRKIPFRKEKEIQKMVEKNLGAVFDLDFIKTEFELDDMRFDTLAFDRDKKSFVIIEYKNSKNFSVIDQGYAYLSLFLNNTAEFVLLYNEIKNKNLRKNEFDWSQSKVVFISPEFTKHRRQAINFKDIPIELWEINQYKNKTIVLNQLKPSYSRASVNKIIPKDTKKPLEDLKPFTEAEHLSRASDELVELYEYIKEQILSFGDVEIKPLKVYIAFKAPRNFADIEFPGKNPKHIKIWLNLKIGTLNDKRKIVKDVSKKGHHGNGDYELTIKPDED